MQRPLTIVLWTIIVYRAQPQQLYPIYWLETISKEYKSPEAKIQNSMDTSNIVWGQPI